ncbi:ATP-binding protein [Pseudoalteromonas sp. OANN1]|uniref:ATP-binding protein n=1 Tax=Pseudoalteromonas sp. OANN1 TaxID=2954497 RepID=UPI002098147F|nr:ATP-binding protein [Pseudoalteromonas sp. OANN1]MCO7198642.1 ATP-binding protein [Pseudoalteromonas sp. OANN1]
MNVEDVFGVSGKQVESYVEREHVDDKFIDALRTDKQIVVYGASKQGKTALVKKYINYEENILISLSPKTTLKDIYQSILRKSGVILKTSYTEGTGDKTKVKAKASIQGAVAMLLKGKVEGNIDKERSNKRDEQYDEIEFNLELPDDVADLIHRVGQRKVIILENFHYLPEELQRTFAYDLRTFQDLKVRFVILGVWKEANRLAQFNGELQDRVYEIPVEPWLSADFKAIAEKGEQLLNIKFSNEILAHCVENAFGSVGVFQELLKHTCIESDVHKKQENNKLIDNIESYSRAIQCKTEEYSGRHLRNLEAIACGHGSVISEDKPMPYFLQYYIVIHILESGYQGLNGGISKEALLHSIKQIHHRKDDLKGAQLTTVLRGLTELQSKQGISPPVIAYDSNSRQLKVVDSTFYFFLKNANLENVKDEIIHPMEGLER